MKDNKKRLTLKINKLSNKQLSSTKGGNGNNTSNNNSNANSNSNNGEGYQHSDRDNT